MASEQVERDLVTGLVALEDGRSQLLRTLDGIERMQTQLRRAGIDVDQITDMSARGGEWTTDPDFSDVILEQVRADSREVGTALADLGITREETGRHLASAGEHLVEARESMAAAAARANDDPTAETTIEVVRDMRSRIIAASETLTRARESLRHVDTSVAAGQAYLSSPVTSPEAARSVATGADLHVEEAIAAATRTLDHIDDGRDRTTHTARDLTQLVENPPVEETTRARVDDPRPDRRDPPSHGRAL